MTTYDDGWHAASRDAFERLQTVADFVRWGASRFNEASLCFGHGTDNAVDEAMRLVLHALHLDRDLPDALLRCQLTPSEKQQLLELFGRRVRQRVPAPYLMGEAWFAGLRLRVDSRVLVPRSPLAEWIERGFEPWLEPGNVSRVLDIGTGSGCIAIACAYAFPEALVEAVDSSADALEVARLNVVDHGLESRVRLVHGDVFEGLEGPYDLIVSNPPYVDARTLENLPAEYRHEPIGGLAAGEDGLDVVRRILAQAGDFLAPDGILVVEVGVARGNLEQAFPDAPFLWLEFERGGEDVFLLHADDLEHFASP
jgi:ribosomal protein L3 glutamine methyltransferase